MRDICLRDVSKSFDGKPVLAQYNACFPAGTITCVMGSSGCGKTTLLNLLLGLLPADGGSITGVPERIAAVFQEDRLCEDFSVLANLRLVTGRRVPRAAMLAHLSRLGLAQSAAAPVSTLSGGMKRRVALIRAILYDAELITLDEPFKGLDASTRQLAIDYLLDHAAGKTVIVVTHDAADASRLGGRVISMRPPG